MVSDSTKTIKVPYRGRMVEAIQVDFNIPDEPWTEIHTQDGSTIKMRLLVNKVLRLKEFDEMTGEPIYLVVSQNQMVLKDYPLSLLEVKSDESDV